ncbi:MarR family winged helix-turn-helix transcriptional regulator [Aquipuribacter nitratireducens]|uniref:MarR family winged helix-turn-helix transcriptional regulator n=1 Tax=Aquipuribacter nitratireducens TaxID=650104 RepID=A0ABW0GTQ8_9MICO
MTHEEQAPADAVDRFLAQWRRERPDLDHSPVGVVGRLSRAARLAEQHLRENFARHDLDPAAYDVLATLRRAGAPYELSPGDLLRTSMVTSGAVTQRLDRLEARGLVTRARSTVDARARVVRLTAAGLDAVDTVLPGHLATERALLSPLDDVEQVQLADLLRRLLAAHERSAPPRD